MPSSAEPATGTLSTAGPPPTGTGPGLAGVAARGAGITLAGQGARVLLQFASVVVLARLLSPRDYGLMTVGLIVIGIGEVVRDLGLSTAAIQAPELTRRQRDGLFWVSAAAGLVLAVVVAAGAGVVAEVFGQPELAPVTRALAFTFVLNGLAAQYRAGLTRDLRFGAVAGTDLVAQLAALAVAIASAAAGAGYWALVAQQLTVGTVALIAVVSLARWVPGPPRRGAGLRPLLRFGGGLTGTQIVYYVGNNLDTMAVGLWSGPASLGIYNRGFQLLMTPLGQLRAPATTVAVPVLSRLHADPVRFSEYLRRAQPALGIPIVTGLALVAGAAVPIVDLLLGERWAAVAPVLALLAVAGSAQTLSYVGFWVYLSRGLSGALLRYTLLTLVLKAVCIAAAVPFGMVGVATGYATAALLEWPLSLWWLSRITDLPVRALLLGALRISGCAAVAGTVCLLVTQLTASWPAPGQLAAGLGAGLAAYGLTTVVPAVRSDVAGVLSWGRQMVGRGH